MMYVHHTLRGCRHNSFAPDCPMTTSRGKTGRMTLAKINADFRPFDTQNTENHRNQNYFRCPCPGRKGNKKAGPCHSALDCALRARSRNMSSMM